MGIALDIIVVARYMMYDRTEEGYAGHTRPRYVAEHDETEMGLDGGSSG
jgi:hypothetical protein